MFLIIVKYLRGNAVVRTRCQGGQRGEMGEESSLRMSIKWDEEVVDTMRARERRTKYYTMVV